MAGLRRVRKRLHKTIKGQGKGKGKKAFKFYCIFFWGFSVRFLTLMFFCRGLSMSTDATPLGSLIQWLALTGLLGHIWALVWACKRCCRMRSTCPFTPSTRVEAGKTWAWEQMHPSLPSADWSDQPRQRQWEGSRAEAKGLTRLIKAKAKGSSRRPPSERSL